MSFLPGWRPMGRGAVPLLRLRYFTHALVEIGSSIVVPAGVNTGDLLVWMNVCYNSGSPPPTYVAPVGFTMMIAGNQLSTTGRFATGYKRADGSESGQTLTGMSGNGTGSRSIFLIVFRPNTPIASASHGGLTFEQEGGEVGPHTITSSASIPPSMALGFYDASGESVAGFATMTPAEDGTVITPFGLMACKWHYFDAGTPPVDVVIDLGNPDFTAAMSGVYIQVAK